MARRKTHPGSLEQRGGSWRLRLMVDGQMHRFTFEARSRSAAEKYARSKHAELVQRAGRKAEGLPTEETVKGLLERFEAEYVPTLAPGTQRAYKDSLKPIRLYFVGTLGDPALDRLHARHIQEYLTWRRLRTPGGELRSRPLSNRSLAKDRAVLHRLFSIADALELREGNPVGRVEAPKAKERDPVLLTEDQYAALLKRCEPDPMLYLYAALLGETGVRAISEGLWVRFEDVSLEEGFLWIDSTRDGRRTKSDKGRWIPMTPLLRQAMREHFARFRFATYRGERTAWLFHHTEDGRGKHGGNRVRAGSRIRRKLRDDLIATARAMDIPDGWVAHDLRHLRATRWIGAGKNPVHVKEVLGHSDLRVTMRYTHLAREHLRSLVEEEPTREALKEDLGT